MDYCQNILIVIIIISIINVYKRSINSSYNIGFISFHVKIAQHFKNSRALSLLND